MSSSDEKQTGFAALIAGEGNITPIVREQRASDMSSQSKQLVLDREKEQRRLAAMGELGSALEQLSALAPENYLPNDVMTYKQGGLQEGVYKKLRTGKYSVEAKLDLHGLTLQQALLASLRFIGSSVDKNQRCVLISHGKGSKQAEPARLKNHLASWLKQMPDVLAYHSALPRQGGAGCVYVLLRKSEEARRENRERYNNAVKDP